MKSARFNPPASLVMAVALTIGLAGCGGGDGQRVTDLEKELEAAKQETQKAKDDAAQAAADAAKKARDDALAEAERKRLADVAAAQQAANQRAEQAQQQAEAEKRRAAEAEEERKAAEERLRQSPQERQFAGFGSSAGTLSVTPRRGAATIGTPDIASTTLGTSGTLGSANGWDTTTGSASDGTYSDTVTIYSDVQASGTVPFKDSKYNANNAVFDAAEEFKKAISIRGQRMDTGNGDGACSGDDCFPTTSGPPDSFAYVDRGRLTQAQYDVLSTEQQSDYDAEYDGTPTIRDPDTHTLRYSVDVVGTLGGAAGIFRCEASSTSSACTVQNRGGDGHFFSGPWSFTPGTIATPNADASVTVADEHFMWFGWWAREHLHTKEWSYAVGHGPAGSRVSSVSTVSGNATYNGTAIGRFVIDDPLDDTDVVGGFTATAVLNADFNANTLGGTLNTFAGDVPTAAQSGGTDAWTVHLRKGSISGGSARGTSGWSIGSDNADEGGSWSASFYSDLPANQRTGVVPYGVAGTFTAEHSGAAKMIGAFGAHTRAPTNSASTQ